jgi:hypothetical protein
MNQLYVIVKSLGYGDITGRVCVFYLWMGYLTNNRWKFNII